MYRTLALVLALALAILAMPAQAEREVHGAHFEGRPSLGPAGGLCAAARNDRDLLIHRENRDAVSISILSMNIGIPTV